MFKIAVLIWIVLGTTLAGIGLTLTLTIPALQGNAMKLLPRGGYLATCSCSHFMPSELFEKMLLSAARDAGVALKLIEARRQSPDHPTLMHVPETEDLKFYLFQIV